MSEPTLIAGPYFEDFSLGLEFDAPAVSVTAGHASWHQALFADRLRLPLDQHTSLAVTSSAAPLCHPLLAINIAIGQSTWASQRVKANLFYRGLLLRKAVHLGDTLYTRTQVVALRQNKPQAGRAATGIVALEMTTTNQHDEVVLHFWRCPMLPCRDPEAVTSHADNLDLVGRAVSATDVLAALPTHWGLEATQRWSGLRAAALKSGDRFRIEARDTVTSAAELVRLSLNMAMAHTDSRVSYLGERLVFGGHTIFMCFAQLTRALPNLLTVIAWENCDHTAPVLEGDRLRSECSITQVVPAPDGRGALLRIEASCFAARDNPETETQVLAWTFWAWSV
jgi:acyl dehydratase